MDFSSMSGWDFERYCADCLLKKGFTKADVTSGSGDHGIDIIAEQNGIRFGIQCKLYQGQIPNKAVQEAYTGASYYDCDVAVIMSNSELTKQAQTEAKKLRVKYWNIVDYIPKSDVGNSTKLTKSTPASYEDYERQKRNQECYLENEMNAKLKLLDSSNERESLLPELKNAANIYRYESATAWLNFSKENKDIWYPIIRSMQVFCHEVGANPQGEPVGITLPDKLLYMKQLSNTFSISGENLRLLLRRKCESIDTKLKTSRIVTSTDSKTLNVAYWEILYMAKQSHLAFELIQDVINAISEDEYAIIEDKDALIALLDTNRSMVDLRSDLTAQVSEYRSSYRSILHYQNIISANLHFCKNSFPFLQNNSEVKDLIEKQAVMLEQPNAKTKYEKKKQAMEDRRCEEQRKAAQKKLKQDELKQEQLQKERQRAERKLLIRSLKNRYCTAMKKINLDNEHRRQALETKACNIIEQSQHQIDELLKKKEPFVFFRKERDAKIDATIATIERHIEQVKAELADDIAKCDAEAQEKIRSLQRQILDEAEKGGVKNEVQTFQS